MTGYPKQDLLQFQIPQSALPPREKTPSDQAPIRSVLALASEEARNVEHNIEHLGDGYELITNLEALFDDLPRLCDFPNDGATNDATYAAYLVGLLMFVCRRQLTLNTLTLLRGHGGDSQLHLRKAVEVCGFASKISKCPHLARVWTQSGHDVKAFKQFRDKFRNLWPITDPRLSKLGLVFDRCSKAMHSSIYGVARYFVAHFKKGNRFGSGLDICDITQDSALTTYYYAMIDAYVTIIRVFEQLLSPYAGDNIITWSEKLSKVEESFRLRRLQLLPIIDNKEFSSSD